MSNLPRTLTNEDIDIMEAALNKDRWMLGQRAPELKLQRPPEPVIYVTQWFNCRTHPPIRAGWYDFRAVDWAAGVDFTGKNDGTYSEQGVRGYFDPKEHGWDYIQVNGKKAWVGGFLGYSEWRGVHEDCLRQEDKAALLRLAVEAFK